MIQGDEIASCVIDKFKSLPNKGKPNSKEWTVLAGICILSNGMPECVAIGTGLKCLNPSTSKSSGNREDVIFDSHAEIICKRNFQRYLISQLYNLKLNKNSILKYYDNQKTIGIDLDQFSVIMYISQAPCGDSSNEALLSSTQNENDTNLNESKKRKLNDSKNEDYDLLRGREHLNVVNKLRTKPGRADCISTKSMSCSDKIASWNILGINGSILSSLITPIYLDTLVIGDLYNQESLSRLNSRISNFTHYSEYQYYKTNKIQIVPTKIQFTHSKYLFIDNNGFELFCCPSSVSWAKGFQSESIVNGRKQGASPKNGVWPESSASLISRRKFLEFIRPLIEQTIKLEKITYESLKHTAVEYQDVKRNLLMGIFKGWVGNKSNETLCQPKIIKRI